MLKRWLLVALLSTVPLTVLALVTPSRVLETFKDVSCVGSVICTDDMSRYNDALELYNGALRFLSVSLTPLQKKPLIVFCATEACYHSFGFSGSKGQSVGSFCIVISPRGWNPYIVRHEMIHQLQHQELGLLKLYREPTWFIEGMAYSLSEDPRPELPPPYQQFRNQFQAWHALKGHNDLWSDASLP